MSDKLIIIEEAKINTRIKSYADYIITEKDRYKSFEDKLIQAFTQPLNMRIYSLEIFEAKMKYFLKFFDRYKYKNKFAAFWKIYFKEGVKYVEHPTEEELREFLYKRNKVKRG